MRIAWQTAGEPLHLWILNEIVMVMDRDLGVVSRLCYDTSCPCPLGRHERGWISCIEDDIAVVNGHRWSVEWDRYET